MRISPVMDRQALEERLKVATAHVALDRDSVRRRQEIVLELERARRDTSEASRLLQQALDLEALDVAEMERLTAELAKLQK
jgi:hypothetical protein